MIQGGSLYTGGVGGLNRLVKLYLEIRDKKRMLDTYGKKIDFSDQSTVIILVDEAFAL